MTIKVGDIFAQHWGYDQTNVNFFQVVKVSPSGKTLYLREVDASRTDDSHVVPTPDAFDRREDYCARCDNLRNRHEEGGWASDHTFTNVYTKRLKEGWTGAPYINWNSYSGASLWDGQPEQVTPIGGGH